ncbi:MAG TPA: hypothetical protein VKJ47_24520 [Candidatus Binatia bacterium]|nr:hypothetical protein [Candidatus Binatia bacterium]
MANSHHRGRGPRPMNIYVRRGSRAEDKYRALGGVAQLEPEELAPGIPPTPTHDLLYHGGKTIPNLTFTNFYVGGETWDPSDRQNIDQALAAAMAEPTLNNVMAQYFSGPPTSTFTPSQTLPGPAPARMSQGDVEQLVSTLFAQGQFANFDLSSTVFNFLLPRGTVLNDNPAPGGAQGVPKAGARRPGVPEEEEADSLNGLGGYHGSVQIDGTTVYYAVGVYSETRNGQTNGIPVFDVPWKNVVATFYHELNEARTDADVEQVIQGGSPTLLGWTSRQGEECGDFPVAEANPLTLVFQEVPVAGGGTVPVQFQYSNYVHGPEGPVPTPDPPSKHRGRHRRM